MTPNEAWELDTETQLERFSKENMMNAEADKVAKKWGIGTTVRVLDYRGGRLGKNPDPYWSAEKYTVSRRDGYKWRVTDSKGRELVRRLKENELKEVHSEERADDQALKKVKETRNSARARRVVEQREQIEPAEETPDETPPQEELVGKTLWDLKPKVGRWIAVDAEGAEEDSSLLRFEKDGKQCFVYIGKVTKLEPKTQKIKLRYLSIRLAKGVPLTQQALGSRYLELLSSDQTLIGSTSATTLLFLGKMDFTTNRAGKGSIPADVVAKIKERYDAEGEAEVEEDPDDE
jgi:hypothetical protein